MSFGNSEGQQNARECGGILSRIRQAIQNVKSYGAFRTG